MINHYYVLFHKHVFQRISKNFIDLKIYNTVTVDYFCYSYQKETHNVILPWKNSFQCVTRDQSDYCKYAEQNGNQQTTLALGLQDRHSSLLCICCRSDLSNLMYH